MMEQSERNDKENQDHSNLNFAFPYNNNKIHVSTKMLSNLLRRMECAIAFVWSQALLCSISQLFCTINLCGPKTTYF